MLKDIKTAYQCFTAPQLLLVSLRPCLLKVLHNYAFQRIASLTIATLLV